MVESDMAHLSVVIPFYKAEACLTELHRRLKESLEPITPDYEIVRVEDCGGDRSWEIIDELSRKDRRVRRQDSPLKGLVSSVFYVLFSGLADLKWEGQVGNFRIMSRTVVEAFRQRREKLRFFGFVQCLRAVIFDVAVRGWASLIVSIYFIGGLISAKRTG